MSSDDDHLAFMAELGITFGEEESSSSSSFVSTSSALDSASANTPLSSAAASTPADTGMEVDNFLEDFGIGISEAPVSTTEITVYNVDETVNTENSPLSSSTARKHDGSHQTDDDFLASFGLDIMEMAATGVDTPISPTAGAASSIALEDVEKEMAAIFGASTSRQKPPMMTATATTTSGELLTLSSSSMESLAMEEKGDVGDAPSAGIAGTSTASKTDTDAQVLAELAEEEEEDVLDTGRRDLLEYATRVRVSEEDLNRRTKPRLSETAMEAEKLTKWGRYSFELLSEYARLMQQKQKQSENLLQMRAKKAETEREYMMDMSEDCEEDGDRLNLFFTLAVSIPRDPETGGPSLDSHWNSRIEFEINDRVACVMIPHGPLLMRQTQLALQNVRAAKNPAKAALKVAQQHTELFTKTNKSSKMALSTGIWLPKGEMQHLARDEADVDQINYLNFAMTTTKAEGNNFLARQQRGTVKLTAYGPVVVDLKVFTTPPDFEEHGNAPKQSTGLTFVRHTMVQPTSDFLSDLKDVVDADQDEEAVSEADKGDKNETVRQDRIRRIKKKIRMMKICGANAFSVARTTTKAELEVHPSDKPAVIKSRVNLLDTGFHVYDTKNVTPPIVFDGKKAVDEIWLSLYHMVDAKGAIHGSTVVSSGIESAVDLTVDLADNNHDHDHDHFDDDDEHSADGQAKSPKMRRLRKKLSMSFPVRDIVGIRWGKRTPSFWCSYPPLKTESKHVLLNAQSLYQGDSAMIQDVPEECCFSLVVSVPGNALLDSVGASADGAMEQVQYNERVLFTVDLEAVDPIERRDWINNLTLVHPNFSCLLPMDEAEEAEAATKMEAQKEFIRMLNQRIQERLDASSAGQQRVALDDAATSKTPQGSTITSRSRSLATSRHRLEAASKRMGLLESFERRFPKEAPEMKKVKVNMKMTMANAIDTLEMPLFSDGSLRFSDLEVASLGVLESSFVRAFKTGLLLPRIVFFDLLPVAMTNPAKAATLGPAKEYFAPNQQAYESMLEAANAANSMHFEISVMGVPKCKGAEITSNLVCVALQHNVNSLATAAEDRETLHLIDRTEVVSVKRTDAFFKRPLFLQPLAADPSKQLQLREMKDGGTELVVPDCFTKKSIRNMMNDLLPTLILKVYDIDKTELMDSYCIGETVFSADLWLQLSRLRQGGQLVMRLINKDQDEGRREEINAELKDKHCRIVIKRLVGNERQIEDDMRRSTEEEMIKVKDDTFKVVDHDNSGSISKLEFLSYFVAAHRKHRKDDDETLLHEVTDMMNEMDTSGDGEINRTEWDTFWAHVNCVYGQEYFLNTLGHLLSLKDQNKERMQELGKLKHLDKVVTEDVDGSSHKLIVKVHEVQKYDAFELEQEALLGDPLEGRLPPAYSLQVNESEGETAFLAQLLEGAHLPWEADKETSKKDAKEDGTDDGEGGSAPNKSSMVIVMNPSNESTVTFASTEQAEKVLNNMAFVQLDRFGCPCVVQLRYDDGQGDESETSAILELALAAEAAVEQAAKENDDKEALAQIIEARKKRTEQARVPRVSSWLISNTVFAPKGKLPSFKQYQRLLEPARQKQKEVLEEHANNARKELLLLQQYVPDDAGIAHLQELIEKYESQVDDYCRMSWSVPLNTVLNAELVQPVHNTWASTDSTTGPTKEIVEDAELIAQMFPGCSFSVCFRNRDENFVRAQQRLVEQQNKQRLREIAAALATDELAQASQSAEENAERDRQNMEDQAILAKEAKEDLDLAAQKPSDSFTMTHLVASTPAQAANAVAALQYLMQHAMSAGVDAKEKDAENEKEGTTALTLRTHWMVKKNRVLKCFANCVSVNHLRELMNADVEQHSTDRFALLKTLPLKKNVTALILCDQLGYLPARSTMSLVRKLAPGMMGPLRPATVNAVEAFDLLLQIQGKEKMAKSIDIDSISDIYVGQSMHFARVWGWTTKGIWDGGRHEVENWFAGPKAHLSPMEEFWDTLRVARQEEEDKCLSISYNEELRGHFSQSLGAVAAPGKPALLYNGMAEVVAETVHFVFRSVADRNRVADMLIDAIKLSGMPGDDSIVKVEAFGVHPSVCAKTEGSYKPYSPTDAVVGTTVVASHADPAVAVAPTGEGKARAPAVVSSVVSTGAALATATAEEKAYHALVTDLFEKAKEYQEKNDGEVLIMIKKPMGTGMDEKEEEESVPSVYVSGNFANKKDLTTATQSIEAIFQQKGPNASFSEQVTNSLQTLKQQQDSVQEQINKIRMEKDLIRKQLLADGELKRILAVDWY